MEAPPNYFKFTSQHCANVYVVSCDVTENRHVGRRSHLRPKDTLAEVTFPSQNGAPYIEHAQLLAMDYPNMLTAVTFSIKQCHKEKVKRLMYKFVLWSRVVDSFFSICWAYIKLIVSIQDEWFTTRRIGQARGAEEKGGGAYWSKATSRARHPGPPSRASVPSTENWAVQRRPSKDDETDESQHTARFSRTESALPNRRSHWWPWWRGGKFPGAIAEENWMCNLQVQSRRRRDEKNHRRPKLPR